VGRVANPDHLAPDLALGMDQVLESQERAAHLDRETATGFGSHQAAVAGPHPESLERAAPAVDGDQVASPARAGHLEEDGDLARVERVDPLEEDGDPTVATAGLAGPRQESRVRAAHLEEDGDQVASLARADPLEEDGDQVASPARVDHQEEDGRQAAVAGHQAVVAGPRQESQVRAAHLDLEAGQAVASLGRVVHPITDLRLPSIGLLRLRKVGQVVESLERVVHLDLDLEAGRQAAAGHQAAVAGPRQESPARVAPAVDGDQVASPARAGHLEEDGDQAASPARAVHLEEDGDQVAVASQARVDHQEDGDQAASQERVDHLEEDGRQAAVAGHQAVVAGPRQESQVRAAHLDLEAGQVVESQARADHLVGKVVAASVDHGSIWLV